MPDDVSEFAAPPRTKGPTSTPSLGKIAADLNLISVKSAEQCRTAYREFRRMQHALRLNGAQYARVSLEQVKQHAQAVRELWAAVFV